MPANTSPIRRGTLALAAAIVWTSCATTWRMEPAGPRAFQGGTILAPDGWAHLAMGDGILLSRDGPELQSITVTSSPLVGAYKAAGRPAPADTNMATVLPSDLADLVIARAKSEAGLADVTVVDNQPAQLAGRQGFRVHLAQSTSDGLAVTRVVQGVALGDQLVTVTFLAPALFVYDRDLPAFEAVVASLQFDEV